MPPPASSAQYLGDLWTAPLGKCHVSPGLGYTCSPLRTSHGNVPRFLGLLQTSLCWFKSCLYFCKSKATEMPFQSILCQYSAVELNNILTLLALTSILQRCYRRKMSKNLPHLTTLHSGYSRNYLAGVKTPVASLNYHFHPRCASF